MAEKKEKYPSTFTIDNFSSTTKLESNEVKVPAGSKETLNDYNPFDHRQLEHPNSTFGALAHLLKSSLGTGILAMPNAFKNGGLLFGFVGTLVIGIVCTHCVHILVKASHKICRKSKTPSFGFSETAEAVFEYGPENMKKFAPAARITVDIALVVTYYMGTCVYVVFVSGSIQQLVDHYYPSLGWSVHIYMLIILFPLIVICQVRELKYLVPFSMLANIFLVISFAITLYYMFNGSFTIEDKNMIAPISRIPLFLSTVVFAMEGIGVVMPVENNMKKPHHFLGCPGVLNTAMATVVVLYGVIGFFGYLKYGEGTQGSITYNLPVDEILAQSVKALVGLAIFFSYTIQFFVAYDITWKNISPKLPTRHHNIFQIACRTVIVCGTVGIAAAVPNLEAIISLVGAICFSMLGIFIPAAIDTAINWGDDFGYGKWKLWKNCIIMIFSMITLVSGSWSSLLEII